MEVLWLMSISSLIYHVSHLTGGIFAASCYFLYEYQDEFLGDYIVVKNILYCIAIKCLVYLAEIL